ncbi:hypothetical protein PFICI_11726 [Pestalotiopsis fici W106-1]|uniref:Cytochrome P450 n=1 Tax=Pestalotiopsis fici (strain W106-1 / CGMCC3.15140) TaxID=1229662 RepID=W3WR74_PESFW|nr:uncharacterized protein PFICI_11726 [Pestalotiopsis fici W106-1]ETS76339.1 hypothetical protein PFICI_11726 [Pestalotiopsis fici W106-1]
MNVTSILLENGTLPFLDMNDGSSPIITMVSSSPPLRIVSLVVFSLGFVLLKILSTRSSLLVEADKPQKLRTAVAPRAYPHWEPFIGIDLMAIFTRGLLSNNFLPMVLDLVQKYGGPFYTLAYRFVGKPAIVTFEPLNIKELLSPSFRDYTHGEDRLNVLRPLLGDGVFNSNGQIWRDSRMFIRPFLHKMDDKQLQIFEEHFQDLLNALPKDAATVDIQPAMTDFVMDVVTHAFVGQSSGILSKDGKSENLMEAKTFGIRHTQATDGLVFDDYNIYDLIPRLFGKSERNNYAREVNEILAKMIKRCTTKSMSNAATPSPILEAATRLGKDTKHTHWDLMGLITAGKDSTSSALGSVLYCLARNPEVVEKLRAEVEFLDGNPPSVEQLAQFKYLRDVINETLRLFAPISVNMKTAVRDTVLPVGGGSDGKSPIVVKEGVTVGYLVYGVHRRKDLWGADAADFRPERWEGLKPGWSFIPFGGGPRMCLGYKFALTLMSYFIVRFVQSISKIEARDPHPWTEKLGLTLFSKHGVKVSLQRSEKDL